MSRSLPTFFLFRLRWIASLFFITLAAVIASAQQAGPAFDNTGGTEYLAAFPGMVGNRLDARIPNTRVRAESTLWIFSAVENSVDIEFGGNRITRTLGAARFTIVEIQPFATVDEINKPLPLDAWEPGTRPPCIRGRS